MAFDNLNADINNVGSIALALYTNTSPAYDEIEASAWQTTQVSILSICNWAGRILIGISSVSSLALLKPLVGLVSDFMRTRLHMRRAYSLCIVSSLFIISQLAAISVSNINALWIASAMVGVAYGSCSGVLPSIVIEWFGLGECRISSISCTEIIFVLINVIHQQQPINRKTGDG